MHTDLNFGHLSLIIKESKTNLWDELTFTLFKYLPFKYILIKYFESSEKSKVIYISSFFIECIYENGSCLTFLSNENNWEALLPRIIPYLLSNW